MLEWLCLNGFHFGVKLVPDLKHPSSPFQTKPQRILLSWKINTSTLDLTVVWSLNTSTWTPCAWALPELTHSGKNNPREAATEKHITHFYLSSGGKKQNQNLAMSCRNQRRSHWCFTNGMGVAPTKEGTGLQILNSRNLYFLLHRSRWFPFPHWTSTHQSQRFPVLFLEYPTGCVA